MLMLHLRDHPRVCGENCRLTNRRPRSIGSPPRMRGKLPDFGGFPDEPGITPAYAGKTYRSRRRDYAAEDHPRVCGEN